MARFVSFPRRMYLQRRRHFVRRNLRVVLGCLAIFFATAAIVTLLVDGYLLGFVHATLG